MKSLGAYVIEGELGRGAMGVVYAARRDDLRVAIKVLTAAGTLDPEAQARFVVEARVLARLDHPNIVRFIEAGATGGVAYVVLERVEGETLRARLARGRLPPPEAARLIAALAGAVHHAHQRSVLHRDLKPENVIVRPDGTPTIVDFGLARLLETGAGQRLSRTGDVLGTPLYMAPEQALGHVAELGPWTDVYGLGAVFYACLTGSPPVSGLNLIAALEAVVSAAPAPPSRVVEGLDPDLEAICLRCLAKSPAERYPSAASLAAALEDHRATRRPRQQRTRRGGRRSTLVALGAGAVAAVCLGALAVLHARPPAAASPASSPPTARSTDAAPPPAPSVATESPAAQAEGMFSLALDRAEVGDLEGALRSARRVVEVAPDHARAWDLVGRLHDALGDPAAAREACTRALELDPRLASAWLNRGAARFKQDDLEGAEEDLSRAIDLAPGEYNAWFNRATVRAARGDVGRALDDVDALIARFPTRAEPWSTRAQLHLTLGDWRAALDDLAQAVRRGAGRAEATALASLRLNYLMDGLEAAQAATVALDAGAADADLLALRALADPRRAEVDADLALRLAPDHALALAARAISRLRRDDLEAAARDADRAVAGADGAAAAEVHLARARVRTAQGDLTGARADVRAALERAPRTFRTRVNAAQVLVALGDAALGLQLLDQVLEDPQAPAVAIIERAEALEKLGRGEEAAAAYEAAAGRAPAEPIRAELLKRAAAARTPAGR